MGQVTNRVARLLVSDPNGADSGRTVKRLIEIYEREPLTIADLKIDGHELMNLGLSGPMIGETLRLFLDSVLRDPARNDQAYFRERLKSRVD